LSAGLTVYDRLAKVKKHERHTILSKKETLKKEPLLDEKKVKGGGDYVEYRTDDSRLTLEVLKRAVSYGAYASNYVKAEDFLYRNNKVIGVRAVDQQTGKVHNIYAKKIINAAGPWVDTIREKDQSNHGKRLHLTKGVHITINRKRLPLKQAVYFDAPDKRLLFAIPRDDKVYIGTTDIEYNDSISKARMTNEECEYILNALNKTFVRQELTINDVESSWAGVRPLIHEEGKDASEISRKDEIFLSDTGLISIAGGKLTGYRKMAERVVDLVTKDLKKETNKTYSKCQTKHIQLSGGDVGGALKFNKIIKDKIKDATTIGLTLNAAEEPINRYGFNVDQLYSVIRTKGEEAKYYNLTKSVFAMVVYSLEQEMTVSPSDFFVRRTGGLFFHIEWVRKWKDAIINCMAHRLHWTKEIKNTQQKKLEDYIIKVTTPL